MYIDERGVSILHLGRVFRLTPIELLDVLMAVFEIAIW